MAGRAPSELVEQYAVPEEARESFLRKLRYGTYFARLMQEAPATVPTPKMVQAAVTSADLASGDMVGCVVEPPDTLLEGLADYIRNTPRSLKDLSEHFDRSESSILEAVDALRAAHMNVIESRGEVEISTVTVESPRQAEIVMQEARKEFIIGIASDLHFGSKHQQYTWLQEFVSYAWERGVRHILVPGDITAGLGVYRGQLHDLFAVSADEQRDATVLGLPAREGLHWHLLGGNHDYAHIRQAGYDIVSAIAAQRRDATFYGYDAARVMLTRNCSAKLWHPSGGIPYATSYRLQKGAESAKSEELFRTIAAGEPPTLRLLLAGHLHIAMSDIDSPIIGLQCGCYEGQTSYEAAKGLTPEVGGWIVELTTNEQGLVRNYRQEFVARPPIRNDYVEVERLMRPARAPAHIPIFELA
jgi:hypothetical protein